MDSQIKTFYYPNGEIQRVQLVQWEKWSDLDFLPLQYAEGALVCFAHIYRTFLVPAQPWVFGNMVMFHVPDDLAVPFPFETKKYGAVADRLTAVAAAMEKHIRIVGKQPVFTNPQVKAFWDALVSRNCLQIISGKLPVTTFIPVGNTAGYLSRAEAGAAMRVNASFFVMDRFDCSTLYDHIGTPLGLCVKDGNVLNPPLFEREALLVNKDGTVSVVQPKLEDLKIKIGDTCYEPGRNAVIYSRPKGNKTPYRKGKKLVIIGRRVVAVHSGLRVPIPTSGFVLCPKESCNVKPGAIVTYLGMEDIQFGIQVGNSIVRNGKKTEGFISRFYNIRALEPVPFPPCLYPLDFHKARAARIALGADGNGKPMLLWAEGAGKLTYTPGADSCGATLEEMANICSELGMVNGVNLDGGGSAQILINNRRYMLISDRNATDNTEAERPVPLGLIVR